MMATYTPDVVGTLSRKLRSLNDRETALRRQYEAQIREVAVEIKRVRAALATINEAIRPMLCPSCQGTGEESYTDAAGSSDTRPCSSCGGTGIRKDPQNDPADG